MKCPICNSEMEGSDYNDGAALLEYDYECTVCYRYSEHFAYGDTEACVKPGTDWLVWQWSYDVSVQDRGKINMEIGEAVRAARTEHESVEVSK